MKTKDITNKKNPRIEKQSSKEKENEKESDRVIDGEGQSNYVCSLIYISYQIKNLS